MYYLLLALLYPLSLLPLPVLYLLSDGCRFLIYRMARYRKDVVWQNLMHAFPDKTEAERQQIMDRFYRSFCDQWVETLKLLTIRPQALRNRVKGNWSVFETACQQQGKVYALLGHQFNWEWANLALPLHFSHRYAGIFLPQNASVFNRLMLFIRRRTGAMLIPANNMRPYFSELAKNRHMIAFMADQTPAVMRISEWYSFMNRPAPFFKGPEKQARRAGAAVVFVSVRKVKRGYYCVRAYPVSDNAALEPVGSITSRYVAFIEKELRQQPENWMWTHRRWKKTPPPESANISIDQ